MSDMRAPPSSIEMLTSHITSQWPKVVFSSRALECIRLDTLDIHDHNSSLDADDIPRLYAVNRVVKSCGLEKEGYACDSHQLFFTPEQAVRALWYQYNMLTPAKSFETDSVGVLLIWREMPDVAERFGAYTARMRYNVIMKHGSGEYHAGLPSS